MLHLRVIVPTDLSERVIELLTENPGVTHLVVHPGAAVDPAGDEITADIARESANDVIDGLKSFGVKERRNHPGCRRHRAVDSGLSSRGRGRR